MAHLFVKDIKPGLQINDVYMVTQPILRNTTRGDLYIESMAVNVGLWSALGAFALFGGAFQRLKNWSG